MELGAVHSENRIINARPTKAFFIEVLVKDIQLIPSIVDLVDNCIDGARRICKNDDYSNLWVRIETTENRFKISDNCGGISVEDARDYAFRFGRPKGIQPTTRSVGQFGVGMKRALFKLGTYFKIESRTVKSFFVVELDVETWKEEEDDSEWTFRFKELETSFTEAPPVDSRGTTITVTSLHESVAEEFKLENFEILLKAEIEKNIRKH